MKRIKLIKVFLFALLCIVAVPTHVRAGWDPAVEEKARVSVDYFRKQWPALERFFAHAYGYVIFPDVYKGGFMFVGGAHGNGYVYEQGKLVGRSNITQLNLGPQLGGQSFSEMIFFKGVSEFEEFKKGNYELGAQMTAIMLNQAIATNIDYSNGVAVFVLPKAGIMAELTFGGQKFSYKPY